MDCLDLLLRYVDVQAQVELQRDDRTSARTGRRHLLESGTWPNCRSSGAVTEDAMTSGLAPGIEGGHLDGGVIDLRECRHRQLAVGDKARE